MASLVAAVILVAVIGMFGTIDGMDRRMQTRFEDANALAQARTVVTRSMDSMWMSSEAQRDPEQAKNLRDIPARFLLERDGDRALSRWASGGGAPPQRLEVVLSRWPVPLDYGLSVGRGEEWAEYQRLRGTSLRCAFELRPDAEPTDGGPATCTLWWRPLPLAEHGGATARGADPARDRNAIPLITGLTRCVWTVFDNRERLQEHRGIWSVDLPAYVELDLATKSGLIGNWVFEMGWGSGTEVEGEGPSAPGESTEQTEGQPASATRRERGRTPGR